MAIPIFVPLEKSNLPKNPIKYKNMYLPNKDTEITEITEITVCVCVCVCTNVMGQNGQHIFLFVQQFTCL